MRIFEFVCKNINCELSGMIKEKLNPDFYKCEKCDEPMKRNYSSFGISLKGSGFYRNSR